MSIEFMLARLTAQSAGLEVDPARGKPELTREDVMLIASAAPPICFHALMAKCCDDQISVKKLLEWVWEKSLKEWFSNSENQAIKVEARQMNRMAELAVLAFLNPQCPHATSTTTRAAYIGANEHTYRKNFQPHYAFLAGELGFLESLGKRAIYKFKGRNDET